MQQWELGAHHSCRAPLQGAESDKGFANREQRKQPKARQSQRLPHTTLSHDMNHFL